MDSLLSRQLDFPRGTASFLGNCRVGRRACYFLRIEQHDLVLVASIAPPEEARPFARGKHLYFEYRQASDTPLGASNTAVLERFTRLLLQSEARIFATLSQAAGDVETIPGLVVVSQSKVDDRDCFQLKVGPREVAVEVVLARRDHLPLRIFRHGARVTFANACDGDVGVTGAVQQFLLLRVAQYLLEFPLPEATSMPIDTEVVGGREVFAYFAPGRPDFSASLPMLEPGDRLRLSFEVPSQCGHQCVFCVAWAPCDAVPAPLPEAALTDSAAAILGTVAPLTTAIDVVFVGQDALTHPGFVDLVATFRKHGAVQRIAVVTPGTTLATPGIAQGLAAAGLDTVILTLLAPEAPLHDRLVGRPGAFADLQQALPLMDRAGLAWEFNGVLLKENLPHLPALLKHVQAQNRKIRLYLYTSEPMVPLEQAARCAPDMAEVERFLEGHRTLVMAAVSSLHYAPLCRLPEWARPLASHASQSLPAPASPLPDACQQCPAYGTRCPAISQHAMTLFGDAGLVPLSE